MSTAMRTPAKVQSLRTPEPEVAEKSGGSQNHLARAVTLHLAGRREEALKQLQRAIAANEASAEIYRAMGHGDDASQIYQRILEHNPDSEESLSNLVLIGMAKEDFDMVREYSEHLLQLRPESTVALEGLSAWACAADEHALTAKFCTLLVSAVPGHFEGWFNLALAHQKSARWEPAAEAYEEAIKLRANSCEAHTNLGIVREQLGDAAAAR